VVAVIPVQISPLAVAITPSGAFAYVTNSDGIWLQTPFPCYVTPHRCGYDRVGSFPVGVAITPNGAFAYVANFNSNTVSVISTVTNTSQPRLRSDLVRGAWRSPRTEVLPMLLV